MTVRWVHGTGIVLGVEYRPVTRARRCIWALHLGPGSLMLITPWWL